MLVTALSKPRLHGAIGGEVAFPHALRQLTGSEYQRILSRAKTGNGVEDYMKINGTPYAVGESAERHGVIVQRSGTARYTRDYYGVLAAAALMRLYGRGREVKVFGSHPPGDVGFRDDLMQAVVGEWQGETAEGHANFRVSYVNTFDEPVGGLMNVLLAEDGQHYQHAHIGDVRSLVIDIGGFTTDFLAVNPGGTVDYSLAQSVPLGIQTVIADFEKSFRSNNLETVKDTSVLPPNRLRQAIATGIFNGGGQQFNCSEDVEEATSLFINRFADAYQNLRGGSLAWDTLILTGGGSALLYSRIKPILKHKNVILADEVETLHLANVRGGMKLWRLYEKLEIV
jgi:hypothetical protein